MPDYICTMRDSSYSKNGIRLSAPGLSQLKQLEYTTGKHFPGEANALT